MWLRYVIEQWVCCPKQSSHKGGGTLVALSHLLLSFESASLWRENASKGHRAYERTMGSAAVLGLALMC